MEYGKMSMTQLREALAANKKAELEIHAALENRTKSNESFRPGDKLEIGQDGAIHVLESGDQKRLRESRVRTFRGLGISQAGAEAIADRDDRGAA
jgi:hypothetical protein